MSFKVTVETEGEILATYQFDRVDIETIAAGVVIKGESGLAGLRAYEEAKTKQMQQSWRDRSPLL